MGDRDSRPIFFIVIPPWLSRIHNKSTLYIVDSLRFQYPYCEFTINSLSLSWIYFEFFIISLCVSFSLRIYSDYRASTLDFWWNDYLYCEFTNATTLYLSWREFTMKTLSADVGDPILKIEKCCEGDCAPPTPRKSENKFRVIWLSMIIDSHRIANIHYKIISWTPNRRCKDSFFT